MFKGYLPLLLRWNLFFLIAFSITTREIFGLFLYLFVALTLALLAIDWRSKIASLAALRGHLFAIAPLVFVSLFSITWFGLPIGRAEIMEVFWVAAILCLGLQKTSFSEREIIWSMQAAIVLGLMLAIYERFFLGIDRVAGGGNAINFGIAAALALTFLLARALLDADRSWPMILACIGGVILLGLTQSRGPTLALAAAAIFLLYLARQRLTINVETLGKKTLLIISMSLSLGLLVALLFIRTASEIEGARVLQDSPSGIRLRMIEAGVQLVMTHPWIGVGADQVGTTLGALAPDLERFNSLHNSWLNLSAELGIFGGLAYLWIYICLAWFFGKALRSGRLVNGGTGIAIAITLFLASLTQDIISMAYTRQLMAAYMALMLTLALAKRDATAV